MKYDYKLSICMMVKDEEKNLRRCLQNLKPLVDAGIAELIIVDTGSEDSTVSIAREYTNKIYFHKWNKDFSQMRNISISYAKGQWIFIIDADERLDNLEKLINLINSSRLNSYNTAIIQVKNLYNLIDENKYNLISSPRIFRNDGQFKYKGAVHNQPVFKEPKINIDISLTHFGYNTTDKELMEKKYKRTTELLKEELRKDPKNLYYIYQLGVSYDMHNETREALNEFRKGYEILKKLNKKTKGIYDYVYASYARIAYINKEFQESVKIAKETLEIRSDYIDMYYILGLGEKVLGKREESFKQFNKYIQYLKIYKSLDISKDLSIIMYHIDENSVSTAYYEVFEYYLLNQKYKEAYENYKFITNKKQKIYSSVNILVELRKPHELKEFYNELINSKDKNIFLCTLEEKIKNLEQEYKVEIYKQFNCDNDIYGLFNKVRLANKNEKLELANILIEKIDFNKEPLFYADILVDIKDNKDRLVKILEKVETVNLRGAFKYITEKDNEIVTEFEDYIIKIDEGLMDINKVRTIVSLTYTLLLLNNINNDEIDDKYSSLFKKYIKLGVNFVSQLYQMDKIPMIYKNVSSVEDRFFLIMNLVNKSIANNEKKIAINYMIEALNTNEALAKYINIYKNELFISKEDKAKKAKNEQFEDYKIQVKNTIKYLMENNKLEEAKEIILEYEQIVRNDVEIVLFKSEISVKQLHKNVNSQDSNYKM